MKFSFNWLKEFVHIPVDAATVARELTMVGIQLESLTANGDDFTLDFEVTVNRPDCLSMLGLSREIAVIFGLPAPRIAGLQSVEVIRIDDAEGEFPLPGINVRIAIDNPELCARYCGQVFKSVKIGPSPSWIQRRLEACGLRSINNVVDITNLVMLELGQPMHAFDYDLLAGQTIRVRKASSEPLVMIDGKERMLRDPMLVIADGRRAVAVAGVMGGLETEVTEQTTSLLLESAYFDPASVRKTAKALELSTDASYRFERGVDWNLQMIACRRAATLLKEYAGAEVYPILDVFPRRFSAAQISLRPEKVARILGEKIDPDFIDGTLHALGFSKTDDSSWEVPSYRVDIFREIDLIEEVARHYGYNRFPSTLPAADKKYQEDYSTYEFESAMGQFLRSAGLDEAYTYSLVSSMTPTALPRIKILNPISETISEMRASLVPNLLESVAYNLRHRNADIRLFEIGRVFLPDEEKVALGIALLGDFQDLKGIIEAALPALQYPSPVIERGKILVDARNIGEIGEHSIESHTVQTCEFYLSDLIQIPKTTLRYQPVIPYPFVERDASFIVNESTKYSELQAILEGIRTTELRSYKLKDRYTGSNIPSGKVSMTMQFIFQAPSRTLTSEEVDALYSKIVDAVNSQLGAELRK